MRSIVSFAVLSASLFFALDSAAAGPNDLTTLRSIGEPKGTFRSSSSGTSLKHVELQVRNVGSVAAEKVNVGVIVPGGKQVTLSGPETLNPNQAATFSADCDERVFTTEKLRPALSCANCR